MPRTDEQNAQLAALEAAKAKRTAGLKSDDEIFNTGTESGKKALMQYRKIEEALNDPTVQQELYNRTVAAVKDPKNRGKKATLSEEQLKNMSPNAVTKTFLAMQKRNIGLAAHGKKASEMGNNPDIDDYTNKNFRKGFTDIGVDIPTRGESELSQAAYIGWDDLIKDRDAGKITDANMVGKLKKFKKSEQYGAADDAGVKGNKAISLIDGVYTNTTAGQLVGIADEPTPATTVDETVTTTETPAAINKLTPVAAPRKKAPWWLQDMIGLAGSVGDFARVKKYRPWQATPDYVLPEPTFYDPNRELAASAERANAMTEGLAQFSGPQALSSRASQIQGTAATQAADILAKYNNMNVGVANQFESERTGIQNRASQERAGLATQLYDKNTIMNQQFDNAKNQARQEMRNMLRTAITNRAYAANLNQMYPQYNFNPWNGGIMNYTGVEAPIKAETTPDQLEQFKTLREALPADVKSSDIWTSLAKGYTATPDDPTEANKAAYLKAMQAGMPVNQAVNYSE
jgi:hypothetical protein